MRLLLCASGAIWLILSGQGAAGPSSIYDAHNERQSYFDLKKLIKKDLPADAAHIARSKSLFITDCVSGKDYASGRDKITYNMAGLAKDVIFIKSMLEHSRYPTELWLKDLENFEKNQLGRILSTSNYEYSGDDFHYAIKKKLNKHRANDDLTLPEIVYESCGGHGVNVKIRSTRAGAKIYIISTLMREYCKDNGLDENDTNQCKEWEPINSQDELYINGDKVVKAVWSDAVNYRVIRYRSLQATAQTIYIEPR
jgi:hypothetical protein